MIATIFDIFSFHFSVFSLLLRSVCCLKVHSGRPIRIAKKSHDMKYPLSANSSDNGETRCADDNDSGKDCCHLSELTKYGMNIWINDRS